MRRGVITRLAPAWLGWAGRVFAAGVDGGGGQDWRSRGGCPGEHGCGDKGELEMGLQDVRLGLLRCGQCPEFVAENCHKS